MLSVVIISMCLAVLVIGSYTDLKTREVPDWVNYGLVFSGFAARIIFSIAQGDLSILLEGILGFAVFFGLALMLYYTGQWGGGDSKMLMGLGAALGIPYGSIREALAGDLVVFLGNLVIVGGLYGVFWSALLVIRNRKRFSSEFLRLYRKKRMRMARRAVLALSLLLALSALFISAPELKVLLVILAAGMFFIFYLWLSVKAIEKSCMVKSVPVEDLTEGDWIVNDIVIKGKRVCGPRDLGISMEQIRKLRRYKRQDLISNVLVKEGIPFVPSFLIAFMITVISGPFVFDFVRSALIA